MISLRQLAIRLATVVSILPLVAATSASAYDLNGAWANDAASCQKIFVKNGATIAFKAKSDIHGSGFIVAGNQIRGRFARCRITSQKESGEIINLLAACATDIMLSDVQFSLKVIDQNNIKRQFPGMDTLELLYTRCP